MTFSAPDGVDAVALFTGEDDRYSTHLEVYPRPDGDVYICGIGGSDYVSSEELKNNANLHKCEPPAGRIEAGKQSFWNMSEKFNGSEPSKTQACMRPCPSDGLPCVGKIPNVKGAYINAGHNCWGILWGPGSGEAVAELMVQGESSYELSSFQIERFGLNKVGGGDKGGRGRKKKGETVGE